MPDISKITLPSGSTYDIKDAVARAAIEALVGGDAVIFIGVSTTEITDGGTETPTVAGWTGPLVAGNLFFYGTSEFIWGKDSKWHELGNLDSLGTLAYKNSASGSFTPSGSVSQPTFTGSSSNVAVTVATNASGNYQPSGTISGIQFNPATVSSTGKFTPSGTVTQPTFTGNSMTATGTFTPSGNVTLTNENKTATVSQAASGTATYTPDGTVSAPTISVDSAGTTGTIHNPTSKTVALSLATAAPTATAPANPIVYYSVADETLSLYQIGYNTGDSITTSDVTVKTGDATYTASAPTFTGTGARLVTGNISVPTSASFGGTEGNVSVSGTPSGTVSQPTFSGTEDDITVSGNSAGSISGGTFTGTKVQISGTVTPEGTVSKPDFTGTTGTVTVS